MPFSFIEFWLKQSCISEKSDLEGLGCNMFHCSDMGVAATLHTSFTLSIKTSSLDLPSKLI